MFNKTLNIMVPDQKTVLFVKLQWHPSKRGVRSENASTLRSNQQCILLFDLEHPGNKNSYHVKRYGLSGAYSQTHFQTNWHKLVDTESSCPFAQLP